MTIYSKWVTSCDEQGQLCLQQQGVVEPFREFADAMAEQLEQEKTYADLGTGIPQSP